MLAALGTAQQQFARTAGVVVRVGAVIVFGNVHIPNDELPLVKGAVSVAEVHLPLTDRFDLGSLQYHARFVSRHEVVFEPRLPVEDLRRVGIFLFLAHSAI